MMPQVSVTELVADLRQTLSRMPAGITGGHQLSLRQRLQLCFMTIEGAQMESYQGSSSPALVNFLTKVSDSTSRTLITIINKKRRLPVLDRVGSIVKPGEVDHVSTMSQRWWLDTTQFRSLS
jgi:hypothetical protein